ncbi:MAG: hypothetical protein AAF487_02995 [Bacteroidota bacterium]
MKNFKRVFRLLAFIALMVLACVGIGLSGGVPLPTSQNRREQEKAVIEMQDEDITETEEEDFKI